MAIEIGGSEVTDHHQQFDPRLTRGAPFFSLMMIGLAAAGFFDLKPSTRVVSATVSTADCESWDRVAVEGLIPLMYQSTATAELKLNGGMAQLRRAIAKMVLSPSREATTQPYISRFPS